MEGKITRLRERTLKLAPLGDIHWGEQGCAANRLKRHITRCVEEGYHFIGTGEYIDFAAPSNRARLLGADLFESAKAAIDNMARQMVDELYDDVLAPTKGRWLALVSGHHCWKFSYPTEETGPNSDTYLAHKLDCAYAEGAFASHVYLNDAPIPVRIFAHHGAGWAQTTGGAAARIERVEADHEADIILLGHLHQMFGLPKQTLDWVLTGNDSLKLVNKPKALLYTGSWLEGWVQGYRLGDTPAAPYAEKRLLRTLLIGAPRIKATPVEEPWGWTVEIEMEVPVQ